MPNDCIFSPCRNYRYRLIHEWSDMFTTPRAIMWIGLNPSTADEEKLDPTLKRIRGFSRAWGYDRFIMTNAFAYRATKPPDMLKQKDPIGPENDRILLECAAMVDKIIVVWGNDGSRFGRDKQVVDLLKKSRKKLFCRAATMTAAPAIRFICPGQRRWKPSCSNKRDRGSEARRPWWLPAR